MAGAITVDFEPLKVAVFDWLNLAINAGVPEGTAGTLPILRTEYDGPRPDGPFVEYKFPDTLIKHGMADEMVPKDGDPTLYKLRGQRSIVISINIISTNPSEILAQIQQSLSAPAECAILRAAGLSVFNDEAFSSATVFQETVHEDRAVLDVTFGYCLERDVAPGLLETMQISGELGGAAEGGTLETTQLVDKFKGDISGILSASGDIQVLSFPTDKTTGKIEYGVIAALQNLVEASPLIVPVGIVAKKDKSFTGIWSGSLPSANYNIEFIARVAQMASPDVRAGSVPLWPGQEQVTVSFPDIDSTDYSVIPTLVHLTESAPILVPKVIIKKTDKSFQVRFPVPLTEGFMLDFIVMKNGVDKVNDRNWRAGSVVLADGVSEKSVTFGTEMPSTNYAVVPGLVNLTDPAPQIQDLVVTEKATTGFTAKWSGAVDSANYKLDYIVREID